MFSSVVYLPEHLLVSLANEFDRHFIPCYGDYAGELLWFENAETDVEPTIRIDTHRSFLDVSISSETTQRWVESLINALIYDPGVYGIYKPIETWGSYKNINC